MKRSVDRILTTHVGSLIRPTTLRELGVAAAKDGGEAAARYPAALEAATADVVRRQIEAGVDVVNDGEFGKSSWANYVLDRMTGFEFRPDSVFEPVYLGRDRVRFADFMQAQFPRGAKGMPGHACVAPISYKGHEAIRRNIADLKAALTAAGVEEGFLTAVAPAIVPVTTRWTSSTTTSARTCSRSPRRCARSTSRSSTRGWCCRSMTRCWPTCTTSSCHRAARERYRRWAALRIEALNHALRGIPEDRVRYHICFGSWHVPHVADAPLDAIVDLMLRVNAGAYSIEAANVRHEHEWRVWEQVTLPPGKILIPGVVTHHTTTVEHPQVVADRLVRFAGLVGKDNVIAGTDCGFAQIEGLQRVHPQVMWAKLDALAAGARLASRVLWS